MKKRAISILLAVALAAVMLVGCTNSDGNNAAAAKNSENGNAIGGDVNGDGKIIVGYIAKNLTDPFHAPINNHAKATFDGLVGDGTIDDWTGILDGETDPAKQVDRADECIAKNCDYVILLPCEATGSDPTLTKLADAGIKVLIVNSKTDSTDEVATVFCGSDDVQGGEMLAEWVIDQAPDGGVYAHCQGIIGNSAQIQRGEGIENILGGNEDYESAGDFPCEWEPDKAADVATDMISKYGDELIAIICDNDTMSSAAQKVCNDAGREDIICVGVDGNENPLTMVSTGEMGATILQDGVGQLQSAIDQIVKSIDGEEMEKEIMIPFVLVTSENVDEYLNH